jgi:mannitol/fructose-specific phosphotransferase system IIA component (Ntr-type)
MKELHNRLIQLQELYFARDEQLVLGDGRNLSDLDKSISALLKKLHPDTADFFQELQERTPPAIAPVVNETCYGCGIDLPTSLCAELQRGEEILHCPNCARYIYPYRGERLDIHDDSIRKSLPRLGIERFSSERLMIPRLQSPDPAGVIGELARRMTDQLYFSDPRVLTDKALAREAIASTAVEHSLAFPHVRGVDTGSLTFALGLSKKGIKFGAPKNRLSRIFFFIVIPIASSAFYLTLLAGLIESLIKADARKKLLACSEPEEVWKTLKKLTKSHIL